MNKATSASKRSLETQISEASEHREQITKIRDGLAFNTFKEIRRVKDRTYL